MAKPKRDEKEDEKGDYEFKLPAFDERAFIRREVASAKASFYTVGLGIVGGIVSTGVSAFVSPERWYVGWLPILFAMIALRPLLVRMKFPEEVVSTKALLGSYFMLFFTGLSVWILGVNIVP